MDKVKLQEKKIFKLFDKKIFEIETQLERCDLYDLKPIDPLLDLFFNFKKDNRN